VGATAAAVRSAVQSCGRAEQEAIVSIIVPTHLLVTAQAGTASTEGGRPLVGGRNIHANVPLGLLTSAALVALRPGAVVADEPRLLARLCTLACSPQVEGSLGEAAAMAAASAVNKWPREGKPLPLPGKGVALGGQGTEGTGAPAAATGGRMQAESEGEGEHRVWSLQEVVELVVDQGILPCITRGLGQGATGGGRLTLEGVLTSAVGGRASERERGKKRGRRG